MKNGYNTLNDSYMLLNIRKERQM